MRTKSKSNPTPASKASILDRIESVAEMRTVITAVLYGRSGTGKTTLSSSFPKPMLVLDVSEKGTDSISDVPGVSALQIRTWQDFEDIYWELKNKNTKKFKSVSIDSVHALQGLALLYTKEQRNASSTDLTTKHDFMRASGLLQEWLISFRDLQDKGINVAFIAHDRTFNAGDEDDGDGQLAPEVGPRLMPSVNSALCGAVKIVGHTFIKEKVKKSKVLGKKPERQIMYCLRIGPHGVYTTKLRSPKSSPVPEYIVDPDFDKLVEAMKGTAAQEAEAEPEAVTTPRRRKK